MKEKISNKEVHRFNIAIPAPLFKKIKRSAQRERRSVTAQILLAIEWITQYEKDEPTQPSETA